MTTTGDTLADVNAAMLAFGNTVLSQRHLVNVKDYAVGGVVTEEAFVTALAENTRLFIPNDVLITVSETIILPSDRFITGGGTIRAADSRLLEWTLFSVAAKANIRIEGITLDANYANQTLDVNLRTSIDAVRVSGQSTGIKLHRVKMSDWRYAVTSPADGQFRTDCRVSECIIVGGYGGVGATSWKNSRIDDNTVSGQKHFGISIYNARDTVVKRNTIVNIDRVNSASAGISAATAQDCDIIANYILGTACHGIRLDTNAHRTRVSRNRLTNIGWVGGVIPSGSGSSCGVAAWEGSAGAYSIGVKIDHNDMQTITGYGISAHYGLDDIYIGGNRIDDVGDPGIAVQASGRITANKIRNCDGPAIVLGWDDDNANTAQAHDQIVALNDIGPTNGAGIHVNGATRFAIKDNIIHHAGNAPALPTHHRSGIYLTAEHPLSHTLTSNGVVRDNLISGCSGYGIYNECGPSVSVGPNVIVNNVEGEDWP